MRNTIERTVLVAMLLLALTASGRAGDTPEPQPRAINRYITRPALEAVLDKPTTVYADPIEEPDIPLPAELVAVLVASCEADGVPLSLALAVMDIETGGTFDPTVVNPVSGCYGLMQLNPEYFASGLTPAENIRAGIAYLGELLARYDTTEAALTAYHDGHDTGRRGYASAVLAAAEKWR